MSNKTFFTYLVATSAGAGLALAALLALFPSAQAHAGFAVGTVVLFAIICAGLFFAGKNAAGSSSKLAFNNLVSISVFAKMLVALAGLFAYQQTTHPENTWFVGIFLLIYVIYTVFEVWFMTKLAKKNSG
ncbi:MAG: hypothetical protein ABMA02_16775 [Saprospiraceae bacterium]